MIQDAVNRIKSVYDAMVAVKLVDPFKFPNSAEACVAKFVSVLENDIDGGNVNPVKQADTYNAAVDLYNEITKDAASASAGEFVSEEEPAPVEGDNGSDNQKIQEEEPQMATAKKNKSGKGAPKESAKPKPKSKSKSVSASAPAKGKSKGNSEALKKARGGVPRDVFGFGMETKAHEFGKMLLRDKGVTTGELREAAWNETKDRFRNTFKKLEEKALAKKDKDGRMFATATTKSKATKK